MPKIKKSKKDNISKIVNMYEYIDKDLLLESDNPNYHLHNLKIPFRMIVNAPSGQGKTNFITNLLRVFCHGDGTFKNIYIITLDKDEPLYNYVIRVSEGQIIIKEGIENIPELDKFNKKENSLVIFDDLVLKKKQEKICEYYMRCRKYNISVCYLAQRYYEIPLMIRSNINYLVILNLGDPKTTKEILKKTSSMISNEKFMNIYEYATNEDFSVLLIDINARDINKKFRKGFLEYIDINKF